LAIGFHSKTPPKKIPFFVSADTDWLLHCANRHIKVFVARDLSVLLTRIQKHANELAFLIGTWGTRFLDNQPKRLQMIGNKQVIVKWLVTALYKDSIHERQSYFRNRKVA
jgi:hypothetical protein